MRTLAELAKAASSFRDLPAPGLRLLLVAWPAGRSGARGPTTRVPRDGRTASQRSEATRGVQVRGERAGGQRVPPPPHRS